MPGTALLKQHVRRRYPVVDYGRGVYLYDTAGKRYLVPRGHNEGAQPALGGDPRRSPEIGGAVTCSDYHR